MYKGNNNYNSDHKVGTTAVLQQQWISQLHGLAGFHTHPSILKLL